MSPLSRPRIPCKRPDDDVEFVSSQPVKKRRVTESRQDATTSLPQPSHPIGATPFSGGGFFADSQAGDPQTPGSPAWQPWLEESSIRDSQAPDPPFNSASVTSARVERALGLEKKHGHPAKRSPQYGGIPNPLPEPIAAMLAEAEETVAAQTQPRQIQQPARQRGRIPNTLPEPVAAMLAQAEKAAAQHSQAVSIEKLAPQHSSPQQEQISNPLPEPITAILAEAEDTAAAERSQNISVRCPHENIPSPLPEPVAAILAQAEKTAGEVTNSKKRLNTTNYLRASTGMVEISLEVPELDQGISSRGISLPVLEKFSFGQSHKQPRPKETPQLSPKQLPPPALQPVPVPQAKSKEYHPNPIEQRAKQRQVPGSANAKTAPAIPSHLVASSLPPLRPAISPSNFLSPVFPTFVTGQDRVPTTVPAPTEPFSLQALFRPPWSPQPSDPPVYHHQHSLTTVQSSSCEICPQMRHFPTPTRRIYPRDYGVQGSTASMRAMTPIPHPIGPSEHPRVPTFYGRILPPPRLDVPIPMPQGAPRQADPRVRPSTFLPPTNTPPQASPLQNHQRVQPTPLPASRSTTEPPNYQPSPSLIIDIAQTAQSIFPFADVAKRNDVAVEKVVNVFAAIVKVPLLRCPAKDRRSGAGKLATARVREFEETRERIREKKVEELRRKGAELGAKSGGKTVVGHAEIARELGPIELGNLGTGRR